MDRQQVLHIIRKHLQADREEFGLARPLGEVIPRIAGELRSPVQSAYSRASDVELVPIWQVSGFVDGTLSQVEEAQVHAAIQADNSVLAEIVSAVRAAEQLASGSPPPLSADLTSRLTEMVPASANSGSASEGQQATRPDLILASVVEKGDDDTDSESAPKIEVERAASTLISSQGKRQALTWLTLALSTAAICVLGWWFLPREQVAEKPQPDGFSANEQLLEADPPELVQGSGKTNGSTKSTADADATNSLLAQGEDPVTSSNATIGDTTGNADDSLSPMRFPDAGHREDRMEVSPFEQLANEINKQQPQGSQEPRSQMPEVRREEPVEQTAAIANNRDSVFSKFRWRQIDGLVGQGEARPVLLSALNSQKYVTPPLDRLHVDQSVVSFENTNAARAPSSQSVIESAPRLSSKTANRTQTLPFSRAEATVQGSDSRLVLGPDSSFRLSNASDGVPVLNLDYGELALMDLPPGTQLHLNHGSRRLTTLDWQEESSLVLSFSDLGMQVNVRKGEIIAGRQAFQKEAFAISAGGDLQPVRQRQATPRWVDSTQDLLPQHILDRIGDETDLSVAVANALRNVLDGGVSEREFATLQTLARLQSALANEEIFALLGSPHEFARKAAWNRLVSLPEWDPRHAKYWTTAEKILPIRRFVTQIKELAKRKQLGKVLEADHVDLLLRALDLRSPQARAAAHFFLAQQYANGPAYDPLWPPAQRLRAIAAWRKMLGRSVANARANAAGRDAGGPN